MAMHDCEEMIWARCLAGYLMPLVSNTGTKVNLSQPLPPQLVCNQGNHSVGNNNQTLPTVMKTKFGHKMPIVHT